MPLEASKAAPNSLQTTKTETNGQLTDLKPNERSRTGPALPAATQHRSGSGVRVFVRLILLLIFAGGAGAGWFYRDRWLPAVTKAFSKEAAPGGPPVRIVPVNVAPAVKQEMRVYINGLGTVTPLKTVTIRSRVEGELIKVHFTEGQLVNEGDLLAEIDPRPYEAQRDQMAGQLARDEATLKTAQLTLERLQFLAKSEAVSAQDVDNQIAVVQQTEGMLKSDRAMVANADLQLTYCTIKSPISGIIGLRLVDVGNIVRANEPGGLAVVNQVQPIALVFTISQDDIPRVQKRMREGHELEVDAYDRDFTMKLASGRLLATDNQVDSTTGTLRLKAIFEKNEGTLFPNQFVNTRLLVDRKKDAIVVPSSAIQRGPAANYVYIVKSDETVELRNVEVGPAEGTMTTVEKGLREGEIVVTDGLDKLQPKAKVSLRKSDEKKPQSPKETLSGKEEKPLNSSKSGSSAP